MYCIQPAEKEKNRKQNLIRPKKYRKNKIKISMVNSKHELVRNES